MAQTRFSLIFPIAALLILLAAYLPTLQTIPNGSEHYYMIDVGETQIVLNVWGTLHATGYPLYVMTGSALVAALRALGAAPVTAPALVSLLWMALALALLYALALRLTRRVWLASALVLLFGLTRTVWIHAVIAEIYSFGLVLLMLLLVIALWTPPISNRLYWLALIGGFAVAHHRALAMAAPALLYAVWPDIAAEPRKLPRKLIICLLLGLIGFIPYLYLPLREWAGGAWVYGEPGTLAGLWDQFSGREASRFIGAPATLDGLIANFNLINTVLITDLTLPGLIVGLVGLVIGLRTHRRAAITLILSAAVAYAFHVLLYTDVLSALILPILVSVAFGWLFVIGALFNTKALSASSGESIENPSPPPLSHASGERGEKQYNDLPDRTLRRKDAKQFVQNLVAALCLCAFALALFIANFDFIYANTRDETGLETIAVAKGAPPGSTLMIAWGARHFAVGFAKDVLGELPRVTLVDHKADYAAQGGALVTPEYTLYNFPVRWWEERLGAPVYLHAAAPDLVQIDTQPEQLTSEAEPLATADNGVQLISESLVCDSNWLSLKVVWYAPERPTRDLSVFVHLLNAAGEVLTQADQSAPVYGWRPMTTWAAGEVVRDVYPVRPNRLAWMVMQRVRYGLYEQLPTGEFRNLIEREIPVACER